LVGFIKSNLKLLSTAGGYEDYYFNYYVEPIVLKDKYTETKTNKFYITVVADDTKPQHVSKGHDILQKFGVTFFNVKMQLNQSFPISLENDLDSFGMENVTYYQVMEEMSSLFRLFGAELIIDKKQSLTFFMENIKNNMDVSFLVGPSFLFLLVHYLRLTVGWNDYEKRQKTNLIYAILRRRLRFFIGEGFNTLTRQGLHGVCSSIKDIYNLSNKNLISIDSIKFLYQNTETSIDFENFNLFQGFLPSLKDILSTINKDKPTTNNPVVEKEQPKLV